MINLDMLKLHETIYIVHENSKITKTEFLGFQNRNRTRPKLSLLRISHETKYIPAFYSFLSYTDAKKSIIATLENKIREIQRDIAKKQKEVESLQKDVASLQSKEK